MCGNENGTKLFFRLIFWKGYTADQPSLYGHRSGRSLQNKRKISKHNGNTLYFYHFGKTIKTCQTSHSNIKIHHDIISLHFQNISSHFNAFKNIFISHNINAYRLQKSHRKSRQILYRTYYTH